MLSQSILKSNPACGVIQGRTGRVAPTLVHCRPTLHIIFATLGVASRRRDRAVSAHRQIHSPIICQNLRGDER